MAVLEAGGSVNTSGMLTSPYQQTWGPVRVPVLGRSFSCAGIGPIVGVYQTGGRRSSPFDWVESKSPDDEISCTIGHSEGIVQNIASVCKS
jgi:hypothetical protein